MKIAIITFNKSYNYGATLQIYALQKVLQEHGANVEILNYNCENIEKSTELFSKSSKFNIKTILRYFYRKIKKIKFDKFDKENLNLSSKLKRKDLFDLEKNYDLFVTGSDQVFNLCIINKDYSYLLDFVSNSNKKCSYAASFGKERIDKTWDKIFEDKLSSFKYLSIREKINNLQLSNLLKRKDIVTSLDPTLLLNEADYSEIKSQRIIKSKYVFVYMISYSKLLQKKAKEFAKRNGYRVIDSKASLMFLLHSSPKDFLSWIANAEYIFTNSYHGTIFSIIYKKKFIVEDNIRIVELLNMLGIDIKNIDYNKAYKNLEKSKEKSLSYIEKIIELAKDNENERHL